MPLLNDDDKTMMQDIFVSQQLSLLESWREAFPEAVLLGDRGMATLEVSSQTIFWLHTNVDRQHWLEKNIGLILQAYPMANIVALANAPELDEAKSALALGAKGYCHAYSEATVLAEVKAVIQHGGIWLGQEFLLHLIGVGRALVGNRPENVAVALAKLTPREQEVAKQAALGLSNKEIARVLDITERTVKAHLSASFERLGVKDRLQLALILNDGTSS